MLEVGFATRFGIPWIIRIGTKNDSFYRGNNKVISNFLCTILYYVCGGGGVGWGGGVASQLKRAVYEKKDELPPPPPPPPPDGEALSD